MAGRVDISERPAVVEAKSWVSDREADTIVGKGHGGALVLLVDRASKYTLLGRVDAAMTRMLDMLDSLSVHTVTSDLRTMARSSRVTPACRRRWREVLLRPVRPAGRG